jgi:uncharacterized Zn finger protein (UPF0148 family)
MNRLKNNECLRCGVPLVRTDNMPVCSACEKTLKKMYYEQVHTSAKPFKHVQKRKLVINGERMGMKKAQRRFLGK